MNIPGGTESVTVKATRELAALHQQMEMVRAELSRLHQQKAESESRLDSYQANLLVQTNEQLLIGILQAQTHAETCAVELEEMSQSVGLDALTGLPNRVLLLDRLAHAITTARRRRSHVALLFVDLNQFKQINDTLGHAIGDEVLKQTAHCLASLVRGSDTVSRHGGDEFLVLLTGISTTSDAVAVAEKIVLGLGKPRRVEDHVLRIAASIGISFYPNDGEDAATLIDCADTAMYQAKRLAIGSVVVHGEAPSGQRSPHGPALASMQRPLTHYEVALDEHQQRHAELRGANEQLVQAVLSAQDLQLAAEQAQKRQIDFMALVAHELRNPMAPIHIAATLLKQARIEDLPRLQGIIERQVGHMSRLVGDLMDVSRVNTGKLRIDRQRLDMAGVIDDAVEACRPGMDVRLQHFTVQLPRCRLEIDGDPVRLAQILRNLLNNASKYTPDGGDIQLLVVAANEVITMTVSDNGIGITPESLPNIFQPFMQDAHAVDFNGAGLGIGLTVVWELVQAHGGSVTASSAGRGLGSQFVVTLPLADCT